VSVCWTVSGSHVPVLEWTADSDKCHIARLIRFTHHRGFEILSYVGQSASCVFLFKCMWGLLWEVSKTNGSVVVKPFIQTEMFGSQGGGSVSVFSLSHMLPLCVRVNFLTGRSKSSQFALCFCCSVTNWL